MKGRARWTVAGGIAVGLVLLAVAAGALWAVRRPRIPDGSLVVPRDIPSLQEALDLASPGDIIVLLEIPSGIEGPITLRTPHVTVATLRGKAVLYGTDDAPAMTLAADGVEVRGFSVISEGVGVLVTGADCRLENVEIRAADAGLVLRGADRCEVDSVSVHGSFIGLDIGDSYAPRVRSSTITGVEEIGVRALQAEQVLLHHVTISGAQVGVLIDRGAHGCSLVGGSVTSAATAGVIVRDSNAVSVVGMTIESSRAGVSLERVEGVVLRECTIRHIESTGIQAVQTIQGRVQNCVIEHCGQVGVSFSDGRENALVANRVRECGSAGIHIAHSMQTLIQENSVSQCTDGVRAEASTRIRVLYNRITNSSDAAILVLYGNDVQVLRNEVSSCQHGITLVSSRGSAVIGNAITHATGGGLATVLCAGDVALENNTVRQSMWGLVSLSCSGVQILSNEFTGNEIGALLFHPTGVVHVQGNSLTHNRIGLRVQSGREGMESVLSLWDVDLQDVEPPIPPVLTHNVFSHNAQRDVDNVSMPTVFAAGNWWGPRQERDPQAALVSSGVALEDSAWRGQVAIGGGSSTACRVLGEILKQVLSSEGYRVIDLVGMEPCARVHSALEEADIDLAWSRPISACAPAGSSSPDQIVEFSSAITDRWSVVASPALVALLPEPTLSGLASACGTGNGLFRSSFPDEIPADVVEQISRTYNLEGCLEGATQSFTLGEVETRLKLGALDLAIVPSLEETLTTSGFISLLDDRRAIAEGHAHIAILRSTLERYPEIGVVLGALAEELTSEVVHQLVSQVRLLRREVEDVVREFLDPR